MGLGTLLGGIAVSRWLFLLIANFLCVQGAALWSGGVCSISAASAVSPIPGAMGPPPARIQPPSPATSSAASPLVTPILTLEGGEFTPILPGCMASPSSPVGLHGSVFDLEEIPAEAVPEDPALERLKLVLVAKGRRGNIAWAVSGSSDESSLGEFAGSGDEVYSFSGVSAAEMYGKEDEVRALSCVTIGEDSFEDFKKIWVQTRKSIINLRMCLFGFRLFFTKMINEERVSALRLVPAEMIRLYVNVRDAYHALLEMSRPLCMGPVSTPPLPYNSDVVLPPEDVKIKLLNPPTCSCNSLAHAGFTAQKFDDECQACGESFLRRIFTSSGAVVISLLVGLVEKTDKAHACMNILFVRERDCV